VTLPAEQSRIPAVLWISLRAHWALGLFLLAFLTEISRPAIAIAAASFLAGAAMDRAGSARRGWGRTAPFLLAAGTAAAAADFSLGSGSLLSSVSLLVLGVQSVMFLLPKTHRNGWQLCAISFLEFLAAAATTTEIQFAMFLFLFLGLSAGAMRALQAEEATEEWGIVIPDGRTGRTVAMLFLSAVTGFCLTAVMFATTPRIGIERFFRRTGIRENITGFSDVISLRDVTSVKIDRRVVARIEFSGLLPGESPLGLYLRGATYTRIDGARWRRGRSPFERVQNAGFHYMMSARQTVPLASAEIFMEPIDSSVLFMYAGTVAVEGALGEVRTDGMGNYRLSTGKSAVRYQVHFPPGGSPAENRSVVPDGAYLALSPGSEEIRELAETVTAGGRSDAERAELARQFFLSGFRYTLTGAASSVREFLFEKRAGFCEHFAAGLTLLLRAAKIPARVATGYLGGEWSDIGKYLIVRQSDAHAWTEAWIGGRWVTLDATPLLGENSPFFSRMGRIDIYLDWAKQRWNKYVVNYSLQMQSRAVFRGWFALRRSAVGIRKTIGNPLGKGFRAAAAIALIAVALLLGWRKGGGFPIRFRQNAKPGDPPLPRPVARLIRRLSSAGYRRSPGTPLEEMVLKAVGRKPAFLPDAARFLSLYHRDRFGHSPLSFGESAEACRLAKKLTQGLF